MKLVVITGAAGGIGKATVQMCLDKGYVVLAGAIDDWEKSEIESLKESRSDGDRLMAVMLDLREEDQIKAAIAKAVELNPDFFAIVTCGAACPAAVPFEYLDIDYLTRDVYETNVFGNVKLIQQGLPLLKKTRGRVIHISSLFGKTGDLGLLSYSSSKHAGESMVTVLRRELRQFGIKVIITNPGVVRDTYMPHCQHKHLVDTLAAVDGVAPESISTKSYDRGNNSKLRQPEIVTDPQYRDASAGMLKMLEASLERSSTIDAEGCARHIMAGLESPKPKARYISGWDAKLLIWMTRFLPELLMDKVAAAITKP